MQTLHMVFNAEDNKELTLSLTDPKDGLTRAEVENVMQEIISKKAIMKNGANMLSVKKAFIREVTEIPLA